MPDPNKIKLSEVKDRFKTIHLMILGVVMDLLCEDKALIPNSVGRMVLYSVAPEHLTSHTIEGDISKSKPQRDKENLVPKGVRTSIKKTGIILDTNYFDNFLLVMWLRNSSFGR